MSYLGMSLKNPGSMNNYHFYNLFGSATEIIKVIFSKLLALPEAPGLTSPQSSQHCPHQGISLISSPFHSLPLPHCYQPKPPNPLLHPSNGQNPAHGNLELAGSLGLYFLCQCCSNLTGKRCS